MANPRLLVSASLVADAIIPLDEGQAHHVGAVLRLAPGDTLRVFNAACGEWQARVAAKGKRHMEVVVERFLRAARVSPDFDLLFAPVKRHATDLIVEKATELGVRRLRPVITQRTIAETVRLDRLQAIAHEAAEQSERFDAPEALSPLPLPRVLEQWGPARLLFFCDEAGDDPGASQGTHQGGGRARPILEALTDPALRAHSACAVLIGPEGGFTPDERALLRALSFVVPVSLGPRILRAETAAIAALTMLQATLGDWGAG